MPITSQSNIVVFTFLPCAQTALRKDMSLAILKTISRTSDGSKRKTNCIKIKPLENFC